MKRVLITGGSGFIGKYCLRFLREQGYEVFALSSKLPYKDIHGIQWIQRDLIKEGISQELLNQISPSHLLHLAWVTTPGKFWGATENETWLKLSIDLLEKFVKAGGKRVTFAGTCAEYDWTSLKFSEYETPCIPSTLYGTCKLNLLSHLETFSKKIGLSHAWARVFFLYGPYESPQRFVAMVIKGLIEHKKVPCSHGNQIRDFLHVQDVASALVALLDSEVQGIVNIGSGEGISLKSVVQKITEHLGSPDLIEFGAIAVPPNDPPNITATTKRLKEELRWEPRISVEEGIKDTVLWWENNLSAIAFLP